MRLAVKLYAVFALYLALLAGVLAFHVRETRRAARSAQTFTEIARRLRMIDGALGRSADMTTGAEKYLVTHDRAYLEQLDERATAAGDVLRRLDSLWITRAEAARVPPVLAAWLAVEDAAHRLASDPRAPSAEDVAAVQRNLDTAASLIQALHDASRAAMMRELDAAESRASMAARASRLIALAIFLVTVAFAIVLVRAIARPLQRLAGAAREISAGHLAYRLPVSGGGSYEFAQVAGDFNAMAAKLDELERLKREFVSNVSHDLKTPLSSMQETTKVMLDELAGPLSDSQRRLLLLSQESGQRLSSMVAKLVELSRLESRPAPEHTVVDVAQLTRDAVARANATADGLASGAAQVIFVAPTRRVRLRADGDGLQRVLDNLLENAIRFSPANGGGTVRVSIGVEPGGKALLAVADMGPGIADDEKSRVFERFYQTETGRATRSHGVGLGLAICRHIVAEHGGTIRVLDNAPRGSVFCVTLPSVLAEPDSPVPIEAWSDMEVVA